MKVKLHFTLSGNTKYIKPHNYGIEWTNRDILDGVKEVVSGHFGNRALIVINEQILANDNVVYPECYSASWFIDEHCKSELVVLAHGENMKEASNIVTEYIKNISWGEHAVQI